MTWREYQDEIKRQRRRAWGSFILSWAILVASAILIVVVSWMFISLFLVTFCQTVMP
jgi:type IV secretory pathway component VirB8